ncbi:MAG: hypothetical protein AAF386_06505, partial [Pseudomonadota bacterium]
PVLMACTAPQTTADMGTRMTADALPAMLGKPLRYTGFRGLLSGRMTLHDNGSITFDTDSGIDEAGTWRVQDNSLCARLVVLRGGREDCFTVNQLPDGRFVTSHGFLIEVIE